MRLHTRVERMAQHWLPGRTKKNAARLLGLPRGVVTKTRLLLPAFSASAATTATAATIATPATTAESTTATTAATARTA